MTPASDATIGSALCAAGVRLRGIAEEPRREARILLAHVLRTDTGTLLARAHAKMPPGAVEQLESLLARRAGHAPVAHLTGEREFWSLPFAVSPDTLIPRPDTESLIEATLAQRPARGDVRRVLDLGTGSGCLLAAALSEYPAAWGLGTDRSAPALAVAAANLRALGLHERACLLQADWAAPLAGRFDLVLSNPPYIPTADLAGLAPDVRDHEPRAALDGGTDGLAAYRILTSTLPDLLAKGGVAVLEVGQGQADPVAALARHAGLVPRAIRRDLGGVARAVVLGLPLGSAGVHV